MTFALVVETRKTPTVGPGAGVVASDAIDTTGATLLVVAITRYGAGSNATTMSDSNSNTWVSLPVRKVSTGTIRHQLYYCIGGTVGPGHTFSFSSVSSYPMIRVMAFSGTSPSYDVDTGTNGGTALTSLATGSVTPSAASSLVVAALGLQDETVTDPTIDSSFTAFVWVPKGSGTSYPISGELSAYKIKAASSAENPTFTWASGTKPACANIVVFTESAADTTKPLVDSGTAPAINVDGDETAVVFTENVTGDGTGFSLNGTNALTYVSGDGTPTWVFSNASVVLSGDVVTLEYDDTTGDMADTSANVLDSFTGQAVNNGSTVTASPDTDPPVLSGLTVNATDTDEIEFEFLTTDGNGTAYWFVSTSATPPSATDLIAGTGSVDYGSFAVSSSGLQSTITIGSLTAETIYYVYVMQDDSSANRSTIVSDSAETDSGVTPTPTWQTIATDITLPYTISNVQADDFGRQFRFVVHGVTDVTSNAVEIIEE